MPIEISRLPNEPIILMTFSGGFESDALTNAFRRSVELLDEIGAMAYRISDVRGVESDPRGLGELFKALREVRKDKAGSSADPRFHAVLVGGNTLASIYANVMRQNEFGNVQLPVFQTVDEALDYIHFDIDKTKSS